MGSPTEHNRGGKPETFLLSSLLGVLLPIGKTPQCVTNYVSLEHFLSSFPVLTGDLGCFRPGCSNVPI